jgi:hypothetical protein
MREGHYPGMAVYRRPIRALVNLAVPALALGAWAGAAFLTTPLRAQNTVPPPAAAPSANDPSAATTAPVRPRGTKLMLTDGSYQLVREYRIDGDRVRYYSLDSSQWEQIPASMVDWGATKKVAAEEAERDAALLTKVHKTEVARTALPLDIDASLEVAPGLFLPDGDNLWVYDGNKTLLALPQAETDSRLSKGHLIEQVMVPIPIIPTRHSISIHGARAKLRINQTQPEFYMRVSGRRQPELVLIRAKPHGESRHIENLDQIFDTSDEKRDSVPIQRWEVAGGVFRFTLGQALGPGEYAIAERVEDEGASLYVWDFGVDEPSAKSTAK